MDRAPEEKAGAHKGLIADLPHFKIGRHRQLRQLSGKSIIIMLDGIGYHQILAMGTEGAALCEESGKPRISLGVIGSPGVHDAQTEALDLLR